MNQFKYSILPFLIILKLLVLISESAAAQSSPFFDLNLKKGQQLGTVFSRSISIAGDSINEMTYRISGTGIYTVTKPTSDTTAFTAVFRYDGRPATFDTVKISYRGKAISDNGKANPNTDASGLTFNELLWGTPPEQIHVGDSWNVEIKQPWELGGPGIEMVKVMEMDPVNQTVRLKREGYGNGFFENDIHQIGITSKNGKTTNVNINPGKVHWSGYTIFKNGIVISDELIVTRSVTLVAEGVSYKAMQREYILLNAMPPENY